MNDALSWLLNLVHSVDPVLRILLAGMGMMLETSILVGLLIPGDTIVVVASTAIVNWFEYLATILAVISGALAGESIGFALGRYFGHRIRRSRVGKRIGEENWRRAENYLDRRGGVAVFISRFLPVLHSLIPLTVGMSTMRYRRFLAWTIPACVVWTVSYVSVGWLAAGSYRRLSSELHFAGYVFAGIILLFLVLAFGVRKLLQYREEKHMRPPEPEEADSDQPQG
ncbi:MAG: DedA family protein [Microbacteriaceae bacterium]